MTQLHCPGCRLRVARGTAAKSPTCPSCGKPLESAASGRKLVGTQLVAPVPTGVAALAAAVAAVRAEHPEHR
jgi:predicted RNA-binding Zn-ribbon protein involved in translation (DUF1610 family)